MDLSSQGNEQLEFIVCFNTNMKLARSFNKIALDTFKLVTNWTDVQIRKSIFGITITVWPKEFEENTLNEKPDILPRGWFLASFFAKKGQPVAAAFLVKIIKRLYFKLLQIVSFNTMMLIGMVIVVDWSRVYLQLGIHLWTE